MHVVARRRRGENASGAAQSRSSLSGGPDDGCRGGGGLKCPVGEWQERDLAGRAVGPAMELAVEDEAHPDPRADGDERERRDAAAVSVVALGDCGSIDVVLNRRLRAEEAPEVAQHRGALPSRQVRGQLQSVAAGLDHSGAADDGLEQSFVAVDRGVL